MAEALAPLAEGGVVAAIDAGGSKTDSVWVDRAGRVTRLPRLAGCNPTENSAWAEVLDAALAGLPAGTAQLVIGMAGHGEVPRVDAAVAARLAAAGFGHARVMNDGEAACRAAFPRGGGVLVVAGTGSGAVTVTAAGEVLRCGGWGSFFGDEGSAHWIGRQALALAAAMQDGRAPDDGFAARLCAALGVEPHRAYALTAWVAAAPHQRSHIAAVAARIDAMALAGDATAARLLDAAAGQLAAHVTALARRAGLASPPPWTLAGSVGQSEILRNCLAARIGSPPEPAAMSVLAGNLWLGAIAAGWSPDPAWAAQLRQGLG